VNDFVGVKMINTFGDVPNQMELIDRGQAVIFIEQFFI
jgi:hypothetical protein